MIPQYFKGDADEIKFDSSGAEIMSFISVELDSFLDGCFDAADFLLAMYDAGRMPFSDRIPRAAFIGFLLECIANANFVGTHESYIFLIDSIFGGGSSVFFEHVTPGVLTLTASATNTIESDFVFRESIGGVYVTSQAVTYNGELLEFTGFPGIESEAELKKLLAEFVPAGIFPDISLIIFSTSLFLVSDGGSYTITDELFNDIIFFEL